MKAKPLKPQQQSCQPPLDYLILTATYNRGHLLKRIVKELALQASQEGLVVEHVVIDDVSRYQVEYQEIVKEHNTTPVPLGVVIT